MRFSNCSVSDHMTRSGLSVWAYERGLLCFVYFVSGLSLFSGSLTDVVVSRAVGSL